METAPLVDCFAMHRGLVQEAQRIYQEWLLPKLFYLLLVFP